MQGALNNKENIYEKLILLTTRFFKHYAQKRDNIRHIPGRKFKSEQ